MFGLYNDTLILSLKRGGLGKGIFGGRGTNIPCHVTVIKITSSVRQNKILKKRNT